MALIEAITRCSFCGKEQQAIAQMVAGPGVCICNECVASCAQIFATGKGAHGDALLPDWQLMSDEEHLRQLPRIASVAAQVEDNLRLWVQRLRERGVSWSRIGLSLGMARQSAWERFAGED